MSRLTIRGRCAAYERQVRNISMTLQVNGITNLQLFLAKKDDKWLSFDAPNVAALHNEEVSESRAVLMIRKNS